MRKTNLAVMLLACATLPCRAGEPASAWRSLPLVHEGRLAAGWGLVGHGAFVVEGDVLRTEPSEKGLGLLVYTKERFGDCQIRVVYRPRDARANAGLFIRMDEGVLNWVAKESLAVRREANGKLSAEMLKRMREASETEQGAWYAVHHGYEVQMCDTGDSLHRTGAIYSLAPAAEIRSPKYDRWRTLVVTLQVRKVIVELDGQELARFDEESPSNPPRKNWTEPKREPMRPIAGYIGLQVHDPGDLVYFKEVSVRPLVRQP